MKDQNVEADVVVIDASPADFKKKKLVERVANSTGMKTGEVRPVVDAVLQELGTAVANGEVLNLQPFGKLQVLNSKDVDNARILKCKIRQVNLKKS